MRLTVVSLEGTGRPAEVTERDAPDGMAPTGSVLFATLPRSMPQGVADNALKEATPDIALRSDLVVLGVHPLAEVGEDLLDDVHQRTERNPLYLLRHGPDGRPELSHARGRKAGPLDDVALLAALRAADTDAIASRAGALLPAAEALHYVGPNGKHFRAFLRPGFALRTPDDLDRLSFWLLPFTRNRNYFVVDHWSLTGLAHHAAGYARAVDRRRGQAVVESLVAYDEEQAVLESRLRRSLHRPQPDGTLVLLSVNSSGTLGARVAEALRTAGHGKPAVVALATAPDDDVVSAPDAHFTALGPEFAGQPADACPACADKRMPALPIERDSYLMRLSAFTRPATITITDGAAGKSLVEEFAGTGSFQVHRRHADGRHQAFYIDVQRMIDSGRLAEPILRTVDSMRDLTPDLVIHPELPAADALANLVAARLGVPRIACNENRLGALPAADRALLLSAGTVLVVDDVVITGRRLQGYRQEITDLRRTDGQSGACDLAALVAVARPDSAASLRGTKDVVHHRNDNARFFAAYELYLPHWGESDCPWCRERQFLRTCPEAAHPGPLADRLRLLEPARGLTSDLFLALPGAPQPPPAPSTAEEWTATADDDAETSHYRDRFFDLNPGSVFGDVQDADLMLSVAAAVQRLRAPRPDQAGIPESRLDEAFRSPISKVLDPRFYVLGRYYEPGIIASLIRACRSFDLQPPEGDAGLLEGLRHHMGYLASSRRFRPELLLQMALGQLPTVDASAETGPEDETAVLNALRRLASASGRPAPRDR